MRGYCLSLTDTENRTHRAFAMASNSKAFVSVSATVTTDECPQNMPLSGSFPIRAPLTLDDSEFDVSSDATLSDTASLSNPSVAEDDLEAHYAFQEEEEEECFELDECAPLVQLRVTPFAQLSTYDEDEDEDDDGEMFGRVPRNLVVAPRIRVHDVEDENAETLMFTNNSLPVPVSQSLFANELTFSDDTGSDISIEAENDITNGGGIHEERVVDEHGLGIRVACDGYSTATDSDGMSQYSQDSLDSEQFGKIIVALNELENDDTKLHGLELDRNDGIRVDLIDGLELDRNDGIRVDLIENDVVMQRKLEVETVETTDIVEGASNTGLLESNAEDYNDGTMTEQNTSVNYLEEQNPQIFGITGEPLSSDDGFAENIECNSATAQGNAANGSQGVVVSHQGSESEMLVSITKSVVDSEAKLHDSSVGFESNDDACEGNKIQIVECSELSDPALLQECTYLERELSETTLGVIQEDELFCDYHSHENVETLNLGDTVKNEATIELNILSQESKGDGSALDEDVEGLMSVGLEQFREQISAISVLLGLKGSGKNSQEQPTVRSPHGNMNIPKDDVKSQLIYVDSGGESDCNSVTVTYGGESSVFFLKGPACLSSLPDSDAQAGFQHNTSEKEKQKMLKIQTVSVEFLRLILRINLSLEDSLVSKVLCRLVADIGRRSNQEFVIRSAKISAKKLEEDCHDDLDFSLNILVLGKSGVGKSATINSIFGDMKVMTNAFEPGTTSVKEVSGTIDGVKIRILDTPGLRSPMKEQAFNKKILSSVKTYMKKFPLDVVLYVDRVDIQTRDLNDVPILRSITSSLGSSVWQHAILALTHAASTPLDGPSGSPLSYEVFVAQKSYLFQQSITKAVGGLCQLSPSFMCPVSLVENHPLCGKSISGDYVLPNGLSWRNQLLALCFSLKILSQVSSVSGPYTLFDHWKHLFFQEDSRPICHLCSCLLQSPAHLKFTANWN